MLSRAARNSTFLMLCITGVFAIFSSTMSKNPVLKPFATSLEVPEGFWMGFVASASTIPGILVSLPAASLSDIFSRRKILLASAVVFASAPFLYLLTTVWWQLILVRFYHGFATAIFIPVAEASIAELFPSRRGERISLFSSFATVGRGFAPFLGGYILFATDYGYQILYSAVGIVGVTAFLMIMLFLAERRHVSPQPRSSEKTVRLILYRWKIIARAPGIFAASLVQAGQYYAYGAVEFFLVGYLKDVVRLDALLIGAVMGSQIIVVILVKPLMGRVSDKIGRRIPVILGSLVSALPLLALPFSNQFLVLLALSIVYGVGFATVTSSTPALVSELVPVNLIGTAMGFLSMTMDVGQTMGPLLTGMMIASNIGYGGSFPALTAVLLLFTVVFILLRNSEDEETSLDKTQD